MIMISVYTNLLKKIPTYVCYCGYIYIAVGYFYSLWILLMLNAQEILWYASHLHQLSSVLKYVIKKKCPKLIAIHKSAYMHKINVLIDSTYEDTLLPV